ncbi:HDOD domain protein [Phycisphaerae bacterium RAS1]|nr:HDOD domain protein [Phycisphaerae bacterium RAS1]
MSVTTFPNTVDSAAGPLPPHLLKAISRVTEISSLPEITTRIVQAVEDPKATAHDLHEIVKSDPALATKILKVVNSAFYGLPAQIASLDRAILMLGLSAVKNIALAASLTRLFKAEPLGPQFEPRDLWRHCIAVGVCARMLAESGGCSRPDEAFVAGLVHDMGLLIVQQTFGDKLREVVTRCFSAPTSFCATEQSIIGADHQAFGAALAAKWKFPPALRNVITFHHDPGALRPEFKKLVTEVYVADTLCCQQQCGFWLTAGTQTIPDEMLSLISVERSQLDEIAAALPERIQEAEAIFGG